MTNRHLICSPNDFMLRVIYNESSVSYCVFGFYSCMFIFCHTEKIKA
uniref:Uncharacterized protein n=1 Tax=Anguilla anguilla TaxID=7936 RepID=A0A0E9V0Q5_ANGAN